MRRCRSLKLLALALGAASALAACGGGDTTVAVSGVPRAEASPLAIPEILERDADERFTTLLACVELTGLGTALSEPGPLTLFAPTNAAFRQAGVSCEEGSSPDPEEVQQLTRTLLQHVTDVDVRFNPPDGYDPADPPRGMVLVGKSVERVESLLDDAPETGLLLSGGNDEVSSVPPGTAPGDDEDVADPPVAQGTNPIVRRAGINSPIIPIIQADVPAPNGLIQVIDNLILPPEAAPEPPPTSAPSPFG